MGKIEFEVETLSPGWIEFWAGYIASRRVRMSTEGLSEKYQLELLRAERDEICGAEEENRALWDAALDFIEETKLSGAVQRVHA